MRENPRVINETSAQNQNFICGQAKWVIMKTEMNFICPHSRRRVWNELDSIQNLYIYIHERAYKSSPPHPYEKLSFFR